MDLRLRDRKVVANGAWDGDRSSVNGAELGEVNVVGQKEKW